MGEFEKYGKLIFFGLVFVAYVLYGWWKSRQPQEEETSEPWPGQKPKVPGPRPPGAPAPRPLATSWEEELRRLLQGEAPAAPPPARPAPPPLRPAPPALPAHRPQPAQRAAPRHVPEPPAPVPVGIEDPDAQKGRAVRLPSLEVSAQAFLRASQLESQVAERLRGVQERVVTHRSVEIKKEAPPEIGQALGLLRNRSSQRAAIVAAVVLGPPRSLEA